MNVFVWTVCDLYTADNHEVDNVPWEDLVAEAMDPWVELYATFEEAERAVRRADEYVRHADARQEKVSENLANGRPAKENLDDVERPERCELKWDEECHSTRRPPLAFRSWRWQSPHNGDYHLIREMPLRGGDGVK